VLFGCKTCIKFLEYFSVYVPDSNGGTQQGCNAGPVTGLCGEGEMCNVKLKKKKVIIVSAQTGPGPHKASYSVGTGFLSL